MTTRIYRDDLIGLRLDIEPGSDRAPRTVAGDYDPVPLSAMDVQVDRADPEAALAEVTPRLARAALRARPPALLPPPGEGPATMRLHAAIVKAPPVTRQRTCAAEIAGHLTPWREIVAFECPEENRPGEVRTMAYDLLSRIDLLDS
jgi:hypothetical protein